MVTPVADVVVATVPVVDVVLATVPVVVPPAAESGPGEPEVSTIVIVLPMTIVYQLLQRRTSRWLA